MMGTSRLKVIKKLSLILSDEDDSADAPLYYGCVHKGTLREIEQLKKLMQQAKTKVCFQHVDAQYLIVVRATDPKARVVLEARDKKPMRREVTSDE
jgi:hypothetical protein